MEKESIQLVLTYLDKVAEKIGTTGEQIWPWLIKQQYIEAIYPLCITIIIGCCLFFLGKFALKHWHTDKGYSICAEDHEPIWCIAFTILTLILLFSFIGFLLEFGDIFNPEYNALKSLFAMAKP
jgi:hypothetical protein